MGGRPDRDTKPQAGVRAEIQGSLFGVKAMYGWIGTILRVNLSTGKVSKEPLDPVIARDYIGARGLGTKYLLDEVDPKVDPLAPENKLIFMAGPMTGSYAPSAGR